MDTIARSRIEPGLLFTADGFEPYAWAAKNLLPACIFGQVIKYRRNNRVVKIQRRLLRGTKSQLARALSDSEDSKTLNTSFIERLNLTIRQGSSYLCRHTICYARGAEQLANQLELLRCHYNFIRPHHALKFGRKMKTPAMQAGLVTRRLTFREVFVSWWRLFFCLCFGRYNSCLRKNQNLIEELEAEWGSRRNDLPPVTRCTTQANPERMAA